jgi:hypothetical protein
VKHIRNTGSRFDTCWRGGSRAGCGTSVSGFWAFKNSKIFAVFDPKLFSAAFGGEGDGCSWLHNGSGLGGL